MKSHIAEYVSPGHPDRLADAIVESIVDLAVGRDNEALVGVECAVHTDHVFIDGRIAAGGPQSSAAVRCAVSNEEIEEIARNVYREAGYGGIWIHAPEKLKVIQNVCLEPLSDDERAIRSLSDDQNVVTGFACNHTETDYLPPAHFIANYIGRKVDAWRRTASDKFGPDFKVLVHIDDNGGRYEWRRLTLSIQHAPGVFAAEQHELVLPVVSGALAELEARGLAGISNLPLENFILNGMGDFIVGGPEGDNGPASRASPTCRWRTSSSTAWVTSSSAGQRGTTASPARSSQSISTGRRSRLAAGRSAARTRTRWTWRGRSGRGSWRGDS